MSEADQLASVLRDANRELRRCQCGSAVQMLYEPGCTRILCIGEAKTVAALPDWGPAELKKKWNADGDARRETHPNQQDG